MTCTGRNPWHVPPRTNCTRITVALAGSAGARSARECRPSAWMTTETRFHLPIGRSAAPGPGQAKRADTRLSREKRDAGSTVGNPRDRRPRRARIALQKLSADAGRDGGRADRWLMTSDGQRRPGWFTSLEARPRWIGLVSTQCWCSRRGRKWREKPARPGGRSRPGPPLPRPARSPTAD